MSEMSCMYLRKAGDIFKFKWHILEWDDKQYANKILMQLKIHCLKIKKPNCALTIIDYIYHMGSPEA